MALRHIERSRAALHRQGGEAAAADEAERLAPSLASALRAVASQSHPGVDVKVLLSELVTAGFTCPSDLSGISASEACDIAEPLATCNAGFVDQLVLHCQRAADREVVQGAASQAKRPDPQPALQPPARAEGVAGAGASEAPLPLDPATIEAGRCALHVLSRARETHVFPVPLDVAAAISAAARLEVFPGHIPHGAPRAEAKRARAVPYSSRDCEEHALWLEFAGWRKSAPQYASAVRLWGQAAATAAQPGWPPSSAVLNVFVRYFRNGASLQRYLSSLRSVCRLLRIPLGVLVDTERLVRGAEKLTPDSARRIKIRASGQDTRQLHHWTRSAGHPVLAESWVVARHFCLRYSSELMHLGSSSVYYVFTEAEEERKECTITFLRRKCFKEPVSIVRRCICQLQGRTLCGVCSLAALSASKPQPFCEVQYPEALAVLKAAAAALGLRTPESWGTRAFRRGFADEALRAGGPQALFFSGGWRGVAAFGYTSAQSRGAMAAAEWLIDHSESSSGAEEP